MSQTVPGKILIVDDNPSNLKLLEYLLRHHGHTVRTAVDADAALAAVRSQLPNLILMDLQLPGIDGFELTRLLRLDPGTCTIPIIAVTAYAMKGDEERARAAGCDAYVSKPIDTRTFPALVASFLSGSATQG